MDLVISHTREDTEEGVVNRLLARHPQLDPIFAIQGIEFLHVGRHDIPHPTCLDGYMLFFLLFAMEHAARLVVEGPITHKALRNAMALQNVWHCWLPKKYHLVEIFPRKVLGGRSMAWRRFMRFRQDRSIAAFSGGVDATYLGLRHARTTTPQSFKPDSHNLAEVVMIHGFDVPAPDLDTFNKLLQRVTPLLKSLRLTPRIVRTNARAARRFMDWEHSFGLQLACVLHQFAGLFDYGLIASGDNYNDYGLHPWGSTPATDYLMSGGAFDIVHQGAEVSRSRKVEVISAHPIARKAVKVCWEGKDPSSNCGVCEKCVRTRLNFAIVGDESPDCFDSPFDPAAISNIQVHNSNQLAELESIVSHARSRNFQPAWLAVLEEQICGQMAKFADRNI